MNSTLIYGFLNNTVTIKGERYIGFTNFKYSFIWNIFKAMVKNTFYNIEHPSHKRHIKLWAIGDDQQNYNIYFENYYE